MRSIRLAYLLSHPIQYQAPLLKAIAAQPDIDLTVLYESDLSAGEFHDQGFGRAISWDVRLLDGYRHRFLRPRRGLRPRELPNFWRPRGVDFASILTRQNFDALWVHGYMAIDHWRALRAAKRAGLATLLRDEVHRQSNRPDWLKDTAKRFVFDWLDRHVDAFMAIGAANASYYRDLGIRGRKIHSMPYAVDNRWFAGRIAEAGANRAALRQQLGLGRDETVVLFAGKLIPRKRPTDLLEAFLRAKLPNAVLLIAGDGELRDTIETRIGSEDASRVRFLGFQSQAQLAALYDLADLFVLPSEREAWGLVINEAMVGGCAILASSRVGAGADLVRTENGMIFPVGDIAALGAALRDLLSDRLRLAAMGKASRRLIGEWGFAQDIAGLRAALAAAQQKS